MMSLWHDDESFGENVPIIHVTCWRERSGSVVECLTRDLGVVGSSLTSFTGLCP